MDQLMKEALLTVAVGGDTAILLLMFVLSIMAAAVVIDRQKVLKDARKQIADYFAGQSEPDNLFASVADEVRAADTDIHEREALFEATYQPVRSLLTKRVSFLGSLGANAPFIGLLGTVLGIMQAFADLASASGEGPSVVMAGIAEALIATAVGLAVAIPAVVFFNIYSQAFRGIENEFRSSLFRSILSQQKDKDA